ncbi:MAG: sugar ABC transporter substrate-binding protein [Spirochaetales bacterium]
MVRFSKALAIGLVLMVGLAMGASAANVKVAFIVSNQANESQAFSAKEFVKYGPDYGFDVSTFDAKGDTQAESQIVTTCIAQGFKAIFVNPNDIHAIVPALKKAHDAKVVVGMFSSELVGTDVQYRDFAASSDDVLGGQLAAQQMIKAFPKGATIVEIGGQAGHNAQLSRHDGFNGDKGIKGSKITVLDFKACQQWATDQAQAIMEDDIVKYGDKIQGVFVHWDNGATGVIQAAKAAGLKNLFIVGVDGNKAGYVQVKSGDQAVSIAQDFTAMAKKELSLAKDVLAGKKVTPFNVIPQIIYDKTTVNNYPLPQW